MKITVTWEVREDDFYGKPHIHIDRRATGGDGSYALSHFASINPAGYPPGARLATVKRIVDALNEMEVE